MLSPGLYHKSVPREYKANLQKRLSVLEACRNDKRNQRAMMDMCRQDLLLYINLFIWQFNPKKKVARVGPFITWDFQERALLDRPETTGKRGILWCYENDKTAVVEKSREMGASWLFLILQSWLGIFFENVQILDISKSADAVDCKSPDSLFWKIRHIHKHLPHWMTRGVVENKMHFEYPESGSYITGEASTGRAGVGGRASVIFVDEFSLIKEDREVRERTANTSDCRFFNGTHQGLSTEFYRLTQSPEITKIVMHWSEHPDKRPGLYSVKDGKVTVLDKTYEYPEDFVFVIDGSPTGGPFPGVRSPWYDKKCEDIGSRRGVAMELDINVKGSVDQVFDPILIHHLKVEHAREPDFRGEVSYDRDTGVPVSLVPNPNGRLSLWIRPDSRGLVPLGFYGVGADISTGSGATPSCMAIVNAATGEKIGEYVNPYIEPTDLAPLAVALCWLFKSHDGEGATFAWEMQGPGILFGRRVIELGYRNVYYRTAEHSLCNKVSDIPGWVPTPSNTRVLIEDYMSALQRREFLNHSELALEECLAFKYDEMGKIVHSGSASDDPSGARENHGDRVIADALAWKMCKGVPKQKTEILEMVPVLSLAWRRKLHEDRERQEQEV